MQGGSIKTEQTGWWVKEEHFAAPVQAAEGRVVVGHKDTEHKGHRSAPLRPATLYVLPTLSHTTPFVSFPCRTTHTHTHGGFLIWWLLTLEVNKCFLIQQRSWEEKKRGYGCWVEIIQEKRFSHAIVHIWIHKHVCQWIISLYKSLFYWLNLLLLLTNPIHNGRYSIIIRGVEIQYVWRRGHYCLI